MTVDPEVTSPERQQTDESLAHEREQADRALADHLASVDELADVVLGLDISKCIVGGHGGRIWAESVVGAGTTVRFTLPTRMTARP